MAQKTEVNRLKDINKDERLTLQAPTTQNGQTHSNNSSAFADEFFECV